jgi:hypothetical protein
VGVAWDLEAAHDLKLLPPRSGCPQMRHQCAVVSDRVV